MDSDTDGAGADTSEDTGSPADSGTPGDTGTEDTADTADTEDTQEDLGVVPEGACRQRIPSGGQTLALCDTPDGTVGHVRIEGLSAGNGFSSAQLFFGFDSAPTAAQGTLNPSQAKLLWYAGDGNAVYAYQGEENDRFETTASVGGGNEVTVCVDVFGGSASTPGRFILWADGESGADCDDPATLTVETAVGARTVGTAGAVDWSKAWFYQASGVTASPILTVFPTAVAGCELVVDEGDAWQPLCTPANGADHFRLSGVTATSNSRYFYLVMGEDAVPPAGNPTAEAGDGKLVMTGGRNHMGVSWTWFRTNGVTGTQHQLAVDEAALYLSDPTEICVEVENGATDATARVWATGTTTDCADWSTLGAPLLTESLSAPVSRTGTDYVKHSNLGVRVESVLVLSGQVGAP